MLVYKQNELMSDLLFTVHQHGGDDVTWKPPIAHLLFRIWSKQQGVISHWLRRQIDKKFPLIFSSMFFNMNPLGAYFIYQSHNPGKLTFVNVLFWGKRATVHSLSFQQQFRLSVNMSTAHDLARILASYAPINVNPVVGSTGKGRGFDAWDYPPVGLLIVQSDAGVGTFDFDRQKPGINSEAVTKSVPQGFLKVLN